MMTSTTSAATPTPINFQSINDATDILREADYIVCFIQQITLLTKDGLNLSNDGTSGLYYILEGLSERIRNSNRMIEDYRDEVKGAHHG